MAVLNRAKFVRRMCKSARAAFAKATASQGGARAPRNTGTFDSAQDDSEAGTVTSLGRNSTKRRFISPLTA